MFIFYVAARSGLALRTFVLAALGVGVVLCIMAIVAASAPRASSVWEGAVVPVDQIASKEQILTPRVGLVRVTLASGDVKEGRLHAHVLTAVRERGNEPFGARTALTFRAQCCQSASHLASFGLDDSE